MMKIKKGIPLIDQHDKNGMWGGKFGGNFVPETLKKPIEDLENLFSKLRKDKSFYTANYTNIRIIYYLIFIWIAALFIKEIRKK